MTFIQCKKKKDIIGSSDAMETIEEIRMREIIIEPEYQWPGETDAFNLISSSSSGDTLILEVEYGGGCEAHGWKLLSNNVWMKSLPPKMNLYLEHDNKGDMCRALITEKLYFNLEPVKYSRGKQAIFIVNNDSEKPIDYRY
ncbi:MAG: hypothetical protein SGI87_06620 [Flavobacteriales bacterium]|nr:hypothetical protein [Flavobacteriales bacterium]